MTYFLIKQVALIFRAWVNYLKPQFITIFITVKTGNYMSKIKSANSKSY